MLLPDGQTDNYEAIQKPNHPDVQIHNYHLEGVHQLHEDNPTLTGKTYSLRSCLKQLAIEQLVSEVCNDLRSEMSYQPNAKKYTTMKTRLSTIQNDEVTVT